MKDFSGTHGEWEQDPEAYYDNPPPKIIFKGSNFVLTGVFALGERNQVVEQINSVGGTVTRSPTQSGCYVVIGTLPNKQWVTGSAGRKLLTALKLREQGHFVYIISEDYFAEALIVEQATCVVQAYEPSGMRLVVWDEHLKGWFTDIEERYAIQLIISSTQTGYSVFAAGKPKKMLCRIQCFAMRAFIGFMVKGFDKDWIPFTKTLPKEIIHRLEVRLSECGFLEKQ